MKSKEFLQTIDKAIRSNNLMNKKSLYLTALSGGADSIAMTLALKELGYNIDAVHCNFHLRGKESDRDEDFCISFCKKIGIELHIVHFDTKEYANLHKVSIEMAARELRYGYFEQLRKDLGASGICIGHHQEDSVETLLINLIRGTGINGMTGISSKNGYILRPMLDVKRSDIENYLVDRGQSFITDSTNLIDDATRNKIRLNLMPIIRTVNPAADNNIAATAKRLAEVARGFNHTIEKDAESVTSQNKDRTVIDIKGIRETASPEYTLFHILASFNFSPSATEDIYDKIQDETVSGKVFSSSTHRLLLDRGNIIIISKNDGENGWEMKIPESGTYVLKDNLKIHISKCIVPENFLISKRKDTATLDAAKIKFPLKIRTIKKGDWFIPFGMKGRKLVSDYMTDRKASLFDKERQLVVENSDGEILWLVNERTDNRFRITKGTKEAITISFPENSQI